MSTNCYFICNVRGGAESSRSDKGDEESDESPQSNLSSSPSPPKSSPLSTSSPTNAGTVNSNRPSSPPPTPPHDSLSRSSDAALKSKTDSRVISDLHYFTWSWSIAFKKSLFVDPSLNAIFSRYAKIKAADSVPLVNFFNQLYKFMALDFKSNAEAAANMAKLIKATYISRDSAERIHGISKEARNKLYAAFDANKVYPFLFQEVATEVEPALAEKFAEWQLFTSNSPAVMRYKSGLTQRLWIDPEAFEYVFLALFLNTHVIFHVCVGSFSLQTTSASTSTRTPLTRNIPRMLTCSKH